MQYFCLKLVKYIEYLVNIVNTGYLMLQQQGISSHSAVHVPMPFLLFTGWVTPKGMNKIYPSKNEMSILTQFSPSAHLVHI